MFEWLFGKKKERKKDGGQSDRLGYMDGYATTSAYLNSDNNFDASIDTADDRKVSEDSNSGGESGESNDSGDSSGSSDSSGGDSSD